MKQALEIIGDLIKTHKEKPTIGLSEFDQGVNEGLILARRAILNKEGRDKPCKYCAYFIKSIGHNYCANCGRELPTV